MKRFVAILLTLILALCIVSTTAFATTQERSGAVTHQLTVNPDLSYTLVISGTGAMADYSTTNVPWKAHASKISTVIIKDGVTAISAYAFSGCTALKTVDVAYSVESIAETAFPKNTSFEIHGWVNHATGRYAQTNKNAQLKLKELRLLLIGNSHTDDYSDFFGMMIGDLSKVVDTKISYERVMFGGRCLIVNQGASSTGTHYEFWKAGDGMYTSAFAKTWDLVLIQDYRESLKFGADYAPYMQEAVRWIHEVAPGAQVGWVADWAETAYDYQLAPGIEAIKAVQALSADKPDLIIPMGTMVENARTSYFGTSKNPSNISQAAPGAQFFPLLERDEKHMSLELGRYLIGTGVLYNVVQHFHDALIQDDNYDFFNVLTSDPVSPDWKGEFVDDYRPVIKETVLNAYNDPLKVTASQFTKDPFQAKLEAITAILKKELPWSVVKERLSSQVITKDIVGLINSETDLNLKLEDFTFSIKDGIYSVKVNCAYGYSAPADAAFTGGVEGIFEGFYYVNGVKTYGGLLYLDTDNDGQPDTYYYARSSGELVRGRSYSISKTNDLLPVGNYTFDENGKLLNPPAAEPDPTEPEVTEPEVTEPKPTEPEVTEPKPTEPEVTEPKPTEPEVTEPKPTEPEVTEPKPTEPEVTEPKPTEPEVTEPEATEPEVTEPEATEPEATEPKPTEPKPTEPSNPARFPWIVIVVMVLCVGSIIALIIIKNRKFK